MSKDVIASCICKRMLIIVVMAIIDDVVDADIDEAVVAVVGDAVIVDAIVHGVVDGVINEAPCRCMCVDGSYVCVGWDSASA